MKPYEVRCPLCGYLQFKIAPPIVGKTVVEVKCRRKDCATIRATIDENAPHITVEDISPTKRQYPSRFK
jgi:hypothetical protein